MRAHAWMAAAAVVALAGCGGSDETTSSKPSTSALDVKPSATDEQAAADVALRYAHAIGDKDWEAVCATRTEAERASFARDAGSSGFSRT